MALTRKNALFAGHDDGAQNWAIVASLIETALCRARHKAVYADRRTMPNGSGRCAVSGEFAGRRAGILLFHSA
jgi:transposase